MHATILKGILGDFKCTVFQRNLKESYGRPLIYVCECRRKVIKVRQLQSLETVYWSYPISPFGIVACTLFLTNFLEIAVYFHLGKGYSPLILCPLPKGFEWFLFVVKDNSPGGCPRGQSTGKQMISVYNLLLTWVNISHWRGLNATVWYIVLRYT